MGYEGLSRPSHLRRTVVRTNRSYTAVPQERWMPREDSNLNRRYQKPQSYH